MLNKQLNSIYIISKGRPKCTTAQTLTKLAYPASWFIVCGTNDSTLEEYKSLWGDRVLVFDWAKEVKKSELCDNFGVEKMGSGAVPVRNATAKISFEMGDIRHWQMDDDFTSFNIINKQLKKGVRITSGAQLLFELNRLSTFADSVGLANLGVCMGSEFYPNKVKRLSKRVFGVHNLPSDPKKFVKWRGRMNDDLINAIDIWRGGHIEFAFRHLSFTFPNTQQEKGGNTDIYKSEGTVRKTAYAIMIEPRATKLIIDFGRYHHKVDWSEITPKIIKEKHAKV